MFEAILYEKLDNKKTKCNLCRHECTIKQGKRGICGVRENIDGILYTLVYDKVAAKGVDPIEKKPFFHFYPGSKAFSIATMGCNFACSHCQNSTLSRSPADHGMISGESMAPDEIVRAAIDNRCKSISFTYSEPTVFAELAIDTAKLAKTKGVLCTFVTNGYQSSALIKELTGLIQGANIDLKSFSKEFYKKVCNANLKGVLDTVKRMYDAGVWIEITTLLIPGLNDDPFEIEALAKFIYDIDPEIPWHISRYHPSYKMHDHPPTPVAGLAKARTIGMDAGLHYVYTGNVPGDEGENTLCSNCKTVVIHRVGYTIRASFLENGCCSMCGTKAAGLF